MDIPEQLKGNEINLSSSGLNDVAWKYEDALALIEHCEKNKTFILGGDVLAKKDNEYQHNYDNWYFNSNQGNYKDSVKKTKEYITNYPRGDYAFVFVTK